MVSAGRDGDNYSWRIWEDDDLLEVAATLADTLGCGSVSPSPVKTPPRPLSTPPPTALQGGKYFSFPGEVSIASAKSVQSPLDSQGRLYRPSSTGWATPPGPGPSSNLAHSDGNTLAGGSFIMPRRACVCVQVCVSVASQPFPATPPYPSWLWMPWRTLRRIFSHPFKEFTLRCVCFDAVLSEPCCRAQNIDNVVL